MHDDYQTITSPAGEVDKPDVQMIGDAADLIDLALYKNDRVTPEQKQLLRDMEAELRMIAGVLWVSDNPQQA